MSETALLGDRTSFLAFARSPLSDYESEYSSEAELADASAQTDSAPTVHSIDTQTCTAVSDSAAQAGCPGSELTDGGAQTETPMAVAAEAQTCVTVTEIEVQADVRAEVAAVETQTAVAVAHSEVQADRAEVAAMETQTEVPVSDSEVQADSQLAAPETQTTVPVSDSKTQVESAHGEMSVQTITDAGVDMLEWEAWWERAMSLPPPPDRLPDTHDEREHRWKLPPISPTSPKSHSSSSDAWLRATLISEWDVSPEARKKRKGTFSEWAIAAARGSRPRRRSSVQSPTCV
jgi:hypothetical protein